MIPAGGAASVRLIDKIRDDTDLLDGFERTFQLLSNREPVKVTTLHMLLSQARTGSTLVCDYLSKAGDLGWCDEWLNPIWVNLVARKTGRVHLKDNLHWTLSRIASPAGVASINLQTRHIMFWQQKNADLTNMTTRLVYLSRRSRLEQALSLAKAETTKIYHQVTPAAAPTADVSDLAIVTALRKILIWDEIAKAYIDNKECLRVDYEDICQHIDHIDSILSFFGSSKSVANPLK